MMRGASRMASRSLAASAQSCAAAATLTTSCRPFGSKFNGEFENYKKPYTTESRSGAHRHPPRKEVLRAQRAAAAAAATSTVRSAGRLHDEAIEADDDAGDAVAPLPPRSVKNNYPEYSKKKADNRLAFTSNFREPDMKPILEAATVGSHSSVKSSSKAAPAAVADVDDTDVTRIYSTEEVRNMASEAQQQQQQPGEVMAAADDDVLDVLSAETDATAPAHAAGAVADDEVAAEAAVDDDEDEFAEIRSHPFFVDMLRRVERNMIRFRKETRSLGRYSIEAVNECVRPLLQLTDYPLTATQLSHLSHSISPAVLKSSLRDRAACRRLQLYCSQDTDLLLDWSVEDFLRRRYESVHMSWEPMDVICRRFGWTDETLTDRDYLLYFSAFPDYVEMAELKTSASGEPKAVPIADPVARAAEGPIPAKKLLLRRKATADVEPSVTESIRLMGSAAVNTPAKGKKTQRMRQHGGDSVADYFGAVESAANEVDGEEAVKLQHAADTVPPLRQASHPSGRTVKEFSLPKSHAAPSKTATPAATAETSGHAGSAPAASNTAAFDQRRFEEVSNAYHNTKVENSLLRRRMLDTDNVDKAQEMQAQLSKGRNEVLRLEQELERMRELKRHATGTSAAAAAAANFQAPRGLPQYAEAPEFDRATASKNDRAVEDIDDDEIEQALKDFKEEEELVMHGKKAPFAHRAAPTTTSATSATPAAAPAAAAEEVDEYEEVEVEVDDEDADLAAAEDVAAEVQAEAASDEVVVEAEADVPVAPSPAPPTLAQQHDRAWHDELSAAVEQQHEAEMAAEEDFSAALDDAVTATTPASRLQQLASLHDRLSSAADRARRYLTTVEERRAEVLEKLDCQLADANKKVEKLEDQLAAVEEEQTAMQETLAREEAERKAREVEAQLQAQREKRMAELEQQRERARLAQVEAAKAVERQRKAEQEALAMEEELQRKLRDVQSRLRALKDGEGEAAAAARPEPTQQPRAASHAPQSIEAAEVEEVEASPSRPAPTSAAAEMEEEEPVEDDVSASPVSAGQFMCTPEQYDGLHLAADRLKKEIAALESQMESEGDEDDETLMAVLAASRADLEELEDCIASVQANAPWAATRDAKRAKEHSLSAQVADTEAHRLQSAIDNHRFQISLLEKRMHHTSQRAVTNKLKDRISQARKAISQLRMEQDRLRRAGRDALGLPASVSIAETLAHEGKDAEEEHGQHGARSEANGAADAASAKAEAGEADEEHGGGVEEGAEEEAGLRAAEETDGRSGTAAAADRTPASSSSPLSDADKLRSRLDSMVGDIQHLQDSIEAQERSADYDDEETEVVLREMKDKLSQLLRLRDQVQRALVEESVNGPDSGSSGGATPVIRSAPAGAATTGSMVRRSDASVHSAPASSHAAPRAHVHSASKKLRTATRSAGQRRR